jgi:hypothetical protein
VHLSTTRKSKLHRHAPWMHSGLLLSRCVAKAGNAATKSHQSILCFLDAPRATSKSGNLIDRQRNVARNQTGAEDVVFSTFTPEGQVDPGSEPCLPISS